MNYSKKQRSSAQKEGTERGDKKVYGCIHMENANRIREWNKTSQKKTLFNHLD